VHIVTSLNVGGSERFVIDLTREQVANNMSVSILSLGKQSDKLYALGECDGLNVKIIRKRSPVDLYALLTELISCDIVHLHSPFALKVILPVMRLIRKRKIIYTRHGAGRFDTPEWMKLHAQSSKYIKAITFVSEEAKTVFTDVNPTIGNDLFTIDNGVKVPDSLSDYSSPNQSALAIGSVGRMVELKYQKDLLKAASDLSSQQSSGLKLHFFGDGPEKQNLVELTNHLSLTDIATFHGMISDRSKMYTAIDVLCVTSETEGLSLAIIEAMSHGIPVIASDVGGNAKLVKPNETGWLYDFNDIETLTKIISSLRKCPEKIELYGQEAKRFIAHNFSITTAAKRYAALYKN
jgi:glycosyltransferase involved in cell wall biosynthesis